MTVVRGFPIAERAKSGSLVFLGSIYGVAAPRLEIYEGTNMTTPAEYAASKGRTLSLVRYLPIA